MANIFGRAFQKLQSLLGKSPAEVEAVRIEAIRDRRRAEDQVLALTKLSGEARAKGAAAARLKNERELALQKQRLVALARQERIARERADAARRQEQAAEKALIRLEETKSVARRMLLLGRAEADEALFQRTFGHAKPKGAKEYESVKTGEGGLPDQAMFLRGVRYEAFASSNVAAIQYDIRTSNFYVAYIRKEGVKWYSYHTVPREIAVQFYQAASKGIMSWDVLRGRSGTGSRFSFTPNKAPPADLPLDDSASAFASASVI